MGSSFDSPSRALEQDGQVKMLPTLIKLVKTRAVAELVRQRIIGGMVGRPRPSLLDLERTPPSQTVPRH